MAHTRVADATAIRREQVREALLDAADRYLAESGYKRMTMEELAREVGIGKGTIYLHFPSKEELVLAHIDRLVSRVCDRLRELGTGEDAAQVRLSRALVDRVMYRFDNVQHYRQSLYDVLAAVRPALLERRKTHFAMEAELVEAILRDGRSRGEFEFRDAAAVAQAMIVGTNALLPYSLTSEELGKRAEVERRARAVAALLVRGILVR
jgi:AcrR family transcriptional regulator